jgi:hypothetical protein
MSILRCHVFGPTATGAKCDMPFNYVAFHSTTFFTSPALNFCLSCHCFPTTTREPIARISQEPGVGDQKLITDIFPFWAMVQTHPMGTLIMRILSTFLVAMIHGKPPFWPSVVLRCQLYNTGCNQCSQGLNLINLIAYFLYKKGVRRC